MAYRPMGLERAVKAYWEPIDEERKRAARVRDQMFLQMGARRGQVAGQKEIAEQAAQIRETERLAKVERRKETDAFLLSIMGRERRQPSPTDPRYAAPFEFMDKPPEQLAVMDKQNIQRDLRERVRGFQGELTPSDWKIIRAEVFPKHKPMKMKKDEGLGRIGPDQNWTWIVKPGKKEYKAQSPIGKLFADYHKAPTPKERHAIQNAIDKAGFGSEHRAIKALTLISKGDFGKLFGGEYETLLDLRIQDIFVKAHRVDNLFGVDVGKVKYDDKMYAKMPWFKELDLTSNKLKEMSVRDVINRKRGFQEFGKTIRDIKKETDPKKLSQLIGYVTGGGRGALTNEQLNTHIATQPYDKMLRSFSWMGIKNRRDLLVELRRRMTTLKKRN